MSDTVSHTEEVRDLRQEDHKDIADLADISFPFSQSRFVVPRKAGGKVATVNGKLAAASLLRIIRMPSGRKIGFIAWLMTHPDFRGRGLAMKLVEASTSHLREHECHAVVTDVEGYNTGSANIFYGAGYRRVSVWQQFHRWNPLDSLWLWIRSGFAIDPGHFLWVAGAATQKACSWRGRLSALLFNALLALFALSLGGGVFLSGEPSVPSAFPAAAFFIGIISLLAAREVGMRVVACFYKQPLEYRAWAGGWGMSLLIAIGFGRTFPLPGNLYPPGDGWSARHFKVVLGQGAIVSAFLVACLIILGSLVKDATGNEFLAKIAFSLVFVGKPMLLFDTLITVAPFEGFNGRHLRDYNRFLWCILSVHAVVLFLWA